MAIKRLKPAGFNVNWLLARTLREYSSQIRCGFGHKAGVPAGTAKRARIHRSGLERCRLSRSRTIVE